MIWRTYVKELLLFVSVMTVFPRSVSRKSRFLSNQRGPFCQIKCRRIPSKQLPLLRPFPRRILWQERMWHRMWHQYEALWTIVLKQVTKCMRTQRKKSKMSYNSREKAFIPRDQKPIKAVDRLFVRSNRYLKTPIQRKEPYCENNLQLLESTSICERIELRFLISLGALFAWLIVRISGAIEWDQTISLSTDSSIAESMEKRKETYGRTNYVALR